ncbi:MAG: DNA repair protein RecO [Candidatus Magnetomorum sp.]|nr:DNA repair protein RecO [Candidatus Magnetomorum sp.]
MELLTAQGILIRRLDYGDADLILTFLTKTYGKISVIAKSAKKSVKRFGGILELFYILELVVRPGKGDRLAILQTASLIRPFEKIRLSVIHTAYASYWAELIQHFVEEQVSQDSIYHLFEYVLDQLNQHSVPADVLHILFQIRFLGESGFQPNFKYCYHCQKKLDQIAGHACYFDPKKGTLICPVCVNNRSNLLLLSKGTIKHLIWISSHDLRQTLRLKYSTEAIEEGKKFLEQFVPFCIGYVPKSLLFLKKIQNKS